MNYDPLDLTYTIIWNDGIFTLNSLEDNMKTIEPSYDVRPPRTPTTLFLVLSSGCEPPRLFEDEEMARTKAQELARIYESETFYIFRTIAALHAPRPQVEEVSL